MRLVPTNDFDGVPVTERSPLRRGLIVEGGLFDERMDESPGFIELPRRIVHPLFLRSIVARLGITKHFNEILEGAQIFSQPCPDCGSAIKLKSGEVVKFKVNCQTSSCDRLWGFGIPAIVNILEEIDASEDEAPELFSPEMVWSRVPVVPRYLRPYASLSRSELVVHPLNEIYLRILNLIHRKDAMLENEVLEAKFVGLLQKAALDLVFGTTSDLAKPLPGLIDMIKGKSGLVRGKILGRRVDYSGRAVITPSDELKINEIFLPRQIALEILKPILIKETLKSEPTWSNKKLQEYLSRVHPRVLINRQPTLHRFSVLGFKVRVWDHDTIGIHPLVVEPFNADFDGDQMAVYSAVTIEGQQDIDGLMAVERNLRNARGKFHITLRHDYLHGMWTLTRNPESTDTEPELVLEPTASSVELEELLETHDPRTRVRIGDHVTTLGRALVAQIAGLKIDEVNYEINKKTVNQFIERLGDERWIQLSNALMMLASRYASDPFSLEDLLELSPDEAPSGLDEINQLTDEAKKIENPATRLVMSGSRGNWSQLQQMVISKGFIKSPVGLLFVKDPLIKGLSYEEYWKSVHGSRSSLVDKVISVAKPGYLARRLVMASTGVIITEEDCGTSKGLWLDEEVAKGLKVLKRDGHKVLVRTPATCETEGPGVCRVCAGERPAYPSKLGDYVGVIAATTLSEPTTQLTLRVFHTGGEVDEQRLESRVEGTVVEVGARKVVIDSDGKRFTYAIPVGYGVNVEVGDEVKVGTVIAASIESVGVTEAFPKLESLFELRGGSGTVSPESGILEIREREGGNEIRVGNSSRIVALDQKILFPSGFEVKQGDLIVEGIPNFVAVEESLGQEYAWSAWANSVYKIYKDSGVEVNMVDILTILRSMTYDGEWMGIRQRFTSLNDLVGRLGGEAIVKDLKDSRFNYTIGETDLTQMLFGVPKFGSGFDRPEVQRSEE